MKLWKIGFGRAGMATVYYTVAAETLDEAFEDALQHHSPLGWTGHCEWHLLDSNYDPYKLREEALAEEKNNPEAFYTDYDGEPIPF